MLPSCQPSSGLERRAASTMSAPAFNNYASQDDCCDDWFNDEDGTAPGGMGGQGYDDGSWGVDETLYTTAMDTSKFSKEQIARAEEIAQQIQRDSVTRKIPGRAGPGGRAASMLDPSVASLGSADDALEHLRRQKQQQQQQPQQQQGYYQQQPPQQQQYAQQPQQYAPQQQQQYAQPAYGQQQQQQPYAAQGQYGQAPPPQQQQQQPYVTPANKQAEQEIMLVRWLQQEMQRVVALIGTNGDPTPAQGRHRPPTTPHAAPPARPGRRSSRRQAALPQRLLMAPMRRVPQVASRTGCSSVREMCAAVGALPRARTAGAGAATAATAAAVGTLVVTVAVALGAGAARPAVGRAGAAGVGLLRAASTAAAEWAVGWGAGVLALRVAASAPRARGLAVVSPAAASVVAAAAVPRRNARGWLKAFFELRIRESHFGTPSARAEGGRCFGQTNWPGSGGRPLHPRTVPSDLRLTCAAAPCRTS
ncbi:hypothetical protein T492DRAFT_1142704 [Pavlovales sp. CCMP2436]|nr:hypothetical protein T492DRAFT_1142704 [Pavlovales sp. CCMP2436]